MQQGWCSYPYAYSVGVSKDVLILPSMRYDIKNKDEKMSHVAKEFRLEVENEFDLMYWIYDNTPTIKDNWQYIYPGYEEMPATEEEFDYWVDDQLEALSERDWDAWLQSFMDLFRHPTTFAVRDLEWKDSAAGCSYKLELRDGDYNPITTADDDPFVAYFDGDSHILVFGSDELELVGTTRRYIVSAVSCDDDGATDSVHLSFDIE